MKNLRYLVSWRLWVGYRCLKKGYLFTFIIIFFLLCSGCGIPIDSGPQLQGAVREVTDGTNTAITIPIHPERIVSLGSSTDDMVIALAGPKRVVAITDTPENLPQATQIKGRVKSTTESIIGQHPDLVIMPDWMSVDFVAELRGLHLPVYVYRTPTSIEMMRETVGELAIVLDAATEGKKIIDDVDRRLQKIQSFVNTIEVDKRKSVVYYGNLGVGGGKGSTFDSLCQWAGVTNGARILGLGPTDSAGREALLICNPDIIVMPTNTYDKDMFQSPQIQTIYGDSSLQPIKAVKNHRIVAIEARWLMSYSQYMVNATEALAMVTYGYTPGMTKKVI